MVTYIIYMAALGFEAKQGCDYLTDRILDEPET